MAEPGTRWALAEGRVGGSQKFRTYLTLANPQTRAATVTIAYLREGDVPVEQTYAVPAMSRFEVDVAETPGMQDASFGTVVNVTNQVPIVVERSMFWESTGATVSGGTSAMAVRLP